MNSRDLPGIFCPRHGLSPGRTICRWCSHGKNLVNRSGFSSLPSALPRVLPPLDVAVLSFPVDLRDDQFQDIGDSLP